MSSSNTAVAVPTTTGNLINCQYINGVAFTGFPSVTAPSLTTSNYTNTSSSNVSCVFSQLTAIGSNGNLRATFSVQATNPNTPTSFNIALPSRSTNFQTLGDCSAIVEGFVGSSLAAVGNPAGAPVTGSTSVNANFTTTTGTGVHYININVAYTMV